MLVFLSVIENIVVLCPFFCCFRPRARKFFSQLKRAVEPIVGIYNKGHFLEVYVGMTLKHCTIFDDKREIRPEENHLLVKLTWSSFMSVPYWLIARQV